MKELQTIKELTEYLKLLPSVGSRSAERMAYAFLEMDNDQINGIIDGLKELKNKVHKCPICGLYTEDSICDICSDQERTNDQLLVVSYPKDVYAFEKLKSFRGKYHVLNGVLSAQKGIGYEELNIDSLLKRIENEKIKEIIIATNPTVEGEMTALFIAKILKDCDVVVSRLAYGLPMGGQLDYADTLTLTRALEGRTNIK